jgi:KaiC/GvpD/RAD55 family RecA-like ATPase
MLRLKYWWWNNMDFQMDKVELQVMRKMVEEKRQATLTHMYIIDDMMDEILMLDNPEAMREIALFVKEVVKQMEEI